MGFAERAHGWNDWYDGLPDRWRFQVVLWPLLLIGTVNMMLTIGSGFPFGLLVLLAIVFLAIVRLPYRSGRRARAGENHPEQSVRLGRIDWMWGLNQRYDAIPEWRRFWIFPAVLIIAGGINMALTLAGAFPFALLFLLALLVMVAIRAPYVWGWVTPPSGQQAPGSATPRVSADPHLRVPHDRAPAMPAFSPQGSLVEPGASKPTVPSAQPAAFQSAAAEREKPILEHDDAPGPDAPRPLPPESGELRHDEAPRT